MIISTVDIKLLITDNRQKQKRQIAYKMDSKKLGKLPAEVIVDECLKEIKPYLLKEIEWMKPVED